MAKNKKLTQDQLDQLDGLCEDFIVAGDDLMSYIDEVISKRNDGYSVVTALKKTIVNLQEKISKLTDVAESNDWDSLCDDYEGNFLYEEDDGDDDEDE